MMTRQETAAVCYIVPSYSGDSSRHFAHLPRLLSEIAKLSPVYVIVEKADSSPTIPGVIEVITQRWSRVNRLLRMLELAWLVIRLRRRGCRKFFVRIAIGAGFVVGLLGRFLDIETYFWHSGMGKQTTLDLARQRGILSWLRAKFGYLVLRIVIRLSDHLVTGPESMVSYYAREFDAQAGKTIVFYNDIDTRMTMAVRAQLSQQQAREKLELPTHGPIVLFVGRLGILKGGTCLPALIHRVAEMVPDVLFTVVGPVLIPELKTRLMATDLQPHVRMLGVLPNEVVLEYYRAADVYILPSNEDAFPRRLLESMALGVPCVAFDVGGVKDIVDARQLELVVPRGDVEQMAQLVVRLINDREFHTRQAEIGLTRVERFATTRVAQMFVERIIA